MTIFRFGFNEDIYEKKGKTYKIKPHYIDIILSLIVKKMLMAELQFGYVDIPSIEIKKKYDKYWIYIDYLIHKNVIEARNHSDRHSRCKGYRFNYTYIKNLEIQGVVLNKITKQEREFEDIPFEDQAIISNQTFDRLKSDFESIVVDTDNIKKVKYDGSAYIDAPRFFRSLIQLTKLRQGGEYLKFEYKANRLYTNFSFIASYYRTRNILIDGETLVEFDISSSFPLMLALLALQVRTEIVNDYEFRDYCTLLKTKTLYKTLTDALNITINANSKKLKKNKNGFEIANRLLTKDSVKELFQKLLNSKKNRQSFVKGYSNPFFKDIFRMKYECLSDVLDELKEQNVKIYYKLAKLETEYIFSVVEELYLKVVGIKILTLHDAIYVPKSLSEQAKSIWDANMNKLYNKLPDTLSANCTDFSAEETNESVNNSYCPKKIVVDKYDEFWD